jgi:cyclic AMP-responsive element-binding protein 3
VQRKIKNKISAHESRKRKKDYVEGLEERVKLSTERNQHLTKEMDRLQTENKSLAKQLRDLQELVSGFFPSRLQAGTAGTMLMVMVLSFSLFVLPFGDKRNGGGYQVVNGECRGAGKGTSAAGGVNGDSI